MGAIINGYIPRIEQYILFYDNETKIIPGHENLATNTDLKPYLIMLELLKEKVYKEIYKDRNLDQLVANNKIKKDHTGVSAFDVTIF